MYLLTYINFMFDFFAVTSTVTAAVAKSCRKIGFVIQWLQIRTERNSNKAESHRNFLYPKVNQVIIFDFQMH